MRVIRTMLTVVQAERVMVMVMVKEERRRRLILMMQGTASVRTLEMKVEMERKMMTGRKMMAGMKVMQWRLLMKTTMRTKMKVKMMMMMMMMNMMYRAEVVEMEERRTLKMERMGGGSRGRAGGEVHLIRF